MCVWNVKFVGFKTVNGYAYIVNFFRHASLSERDLYTYNLYGTGAAVGFFKLVKKIQIL